LVAARRKEAGLSQKKFAELASIYRQWVERWERDLAMTNPNEWNQLCAVLTLPVDLLAVIT